MKPANLVPATLILVLAAGALVTGAARRPGGSHALLTRAELDGTTAVSVYEAIRTLRSDWFPVESAGPAELPRVYIEMQCADLSCLRWLGLGQIEVIRLLPPEQSAYLATGPEGARAVVVTLRPGAPGALGMDRDESLQ